MMATVPHVTSGSGLGKFQADGFLFDRVYVDENIRRGVTVENRTCFHTAFLTQNYSSNILKYGTSYAGHLYSL